DLVVTHAAGLLPGDAIFCCSRAARDVMQNLAGCARELTSTEIALSLPVIPYGVDVPTEERVPSAKAREAAGLPQQAFIFLFFGRLSGLSKANLQGLLRSFAADFLNPSMLVLAGGLSGVGDQNYVQALAELAGELAIQKSVKIFVNPN